MLALGLMVKAVSLPSLVTDGMGRRGTYLLGHSHPLRSSHQAGWEVLGDSYVSVPQASVDRLSKCSSINVFTAVHSGQFSETLNGILKNSWPVSIVLLGDRSAEFLMFPIFFISCSGYELLSDIISFHPLTFLFH